MREPNTSATLLDSACGPLSGIFVTVPTPLGKLSILVTVSADALDCAERGRQHHSSEIEI
jgi:hypothetical protein